MTRRARVQTPIDPTTKCKRGDHFRTPKNTGTASTGRHFCRPCKYARAAERGDRRAPRPRSTTPAEVVLSVFEIERALQSIPCMGCGIAPTRRGVGKDGSPRWLDAPVTHHTAGCAVGSQREIVQRNRSKGKGVAA